MPRHPKPTKPLAWFDECLVNLRHALACDERDLRHAAVRYASTQREITQLERELDEARKKGKTELPPEVAKESYPWLRPNPTP